jgi:putative transposase
VTNNFELSAEAIADLYKKRWGIELFFKWIKQNLKIKQFLGRSENAVKTHIFTALISYLLLQLYQQKQGQDISLKMCLSVLRFSLFQRIETEQVVHKRERQRRDYMDEIQPQLAI